MDWSEARVIEPQDRFLLFGSQFCDFGVTLKYFGRTVCTGLATFLDGTEFARLYILDFSNKKNVVVVEILKSNFDSREP